MKSSQFKDLDNFEIRPLVIQHTNGVNVRDSLNIKYIDFF